MCILHEDVGSINNTKLFSVIFRPRFCGNYYRIMITRSFVSYLNIYYIRNQGKVRYKYIVRQDMLYIGSECNIYITQRFESISYQSIIRITHSLIVETDRDIAIQ